MDKFLLYLKKYGMYILIALIVICCIIFIPILLAGKKPMEKVTEVIDASRKKIDKINADIAVKTVEKDIKIKTADDKKDVLIKELEVIKTESSDELRRKKVLEFHEKNKKFR